MRLANKVALVLPGAFGIGHDASVRFAREGAKVLVCGTDEENGRRTVEAALHAAREAQGQGAGSGGAAHYMRCDPLHEGDIEAAVKEAQERWGGLDVVFGCPDGHTAGLCADQPLADLDWALAYNCRSLFLLAKHALPGMLEHMRGGAFVYLSSVYAEVSGSASCAYEVSKGTVVNMTLAFAERYAGRGVRFNCIAHGHVVEGPRGLRPEAPTYLVTDEAEADRLARFYPRGRLALPADIASAALYLASDDAAHVTGEVLRVDGGFVTK